MSNYTDTLKRGDKIGCYQIEEVLGRGGFAVTYLATDLNLDVEVAIKEYLPREITQRDANLHVSARKQEFAEDYEVGLQNFAREAKTLARFKHPHIVRVHQVLHANNTAYMVMDFEQGQELAEIMEQRHTLPEEEMRAILFPILDGVEEIHRHGFVHRDIKPSNIYIRHNGSPVLIDFGAARYTMSETTQQLTAVVTVGYTPIEQYNVSEDAQGPWSDIYALAAVCYEAVTGSVPTDSVTRASASVTKGNDPLPSVRSMTQQPYSDDCLDAIDWGLRMEAEDRPQVIAQWRDAFDGIFNPASAYVEKKGGSIYSQQQAQQNALRQANQAPQASQNQNADVLSIPLHQTETPMDTDVVSLDPDATVHRDSSVTRMPPLPTGVSVNTDSSMRAANQAASSVSSERNDTNTASTTTPDTRQAANDVTGRNVGGRDTEIKSAQSNKTSIYEPDTIAPPPARKRSKLERPSDVLPDPAPPRSRMLRDEIQFDETDWDYVPPKKNSPLKLLLPALGLAAVVGSSILFVNNPDLIAKLGGDRGPDLTTSQALHLAQQKMDQQAFYMPAGESALDYYQLILASDPNNASAKAGIAAIEAQVQAQIASNVNNGNLSEANRILATAYDRGLQINALPDTSLVPDPSPVPATSPAPTENVAPVIAPVETITQPAAPTQNTVVTAVDTSVIQPETSIPAPVQQPQITTAPRAPAGIDNTVSPYITEKLAEIESLIAQKRFAEAKALYVDTDKYIPDQQASRALLRKIEFAEQESLLASNNAATQTTTSTVTPVQPAPAAPVVIEEAPAATPRNSFIAATGPIADHLNQLRIAIENKDMDSVEAISQTLPTSRSQFLTRMFQRYDRLDVTIDEVNQRNDSASAKLNVSMFKTNESGDYYPAGKWNGVALSATREDGAWQKIRW